MELTVKDAARLLGASEGHVYRWIHDANLPCQRVSEKYRINRVELLEWATQRQMKLSPEIFAEDQVPRQRLLCDALRTGGVLRDVAGEDKRSVLKSVCQALALPGNVNREELYAVLLAREALSSTAIGNGIAIPHPRGPIVLGVTRPTLTLAMLRRPIDFGALDGRPVDTLFVTVSPTIRLHLQVLSHLMYALQEPAFRALLQKRAGDSEILAQVERVEGSIR